MRKFHRIRLLFLIVFIAAVAVVAWKQTYTHIQKANAVPGKLEIGTDSETQVTYYHNKAIYSNDILFGNGAGGYPGVITAQGQILINMLTPTPGFYLNVNQRMRANGISVNTNANQDSLEVAGAANIQGNVGIGIGAPSLHEVPLTLHSNAVSTLLRLEGSDGDTVVNIGEAGGNATIDNSLTVSGIGNSSFAGRVGIGTTSPGTILQVKSPGENSDVFTVRNSAVSGANIFQVSELTGNHALLDMLDGAGNIKIKLSTAGLSYLTGGNVGIGTTNPDVKLVVSGQDANFYSGTTGNVMRMGRNASEHLAISVDDTNAYLESVQDENAPGYGNMIFRVDNDGTANGYFGFQNKAGTDHVRITSLGNVGIGTTVPGEKLQVNGNSVMNGQMVVGGTGLDGTLRVYRNSGGGGRNNLVLTNGTPVAAGITKSSVVQFKDNNNTLQFEMGNDRNVNGTNDFYLYDSIASADRLYVGSNGNVGIGTTSPGHRLQVAGTMHADITGGNGNLNSTAYEVAGTNIGAQTYYAYGSMCVGNSQHDCSAPSSGTLFNNSTNYVTGNTTFTGNVRSNTYIAASGLGEGYAGSGGVNSNYYHASVNDSWISYPGNNNNYLRGTTYAFTGTWYDETSPGYYLDPNLTSRMGTINADYLNTYNTLKFNGNMNMSQTMSGNDGYISIYNPAVTYFGDRTGFRLCANSNCSYGHYISTSPNGSLVVQPIGNSAGISNQGTFYSAGAAQVNGSITSYSGEHIASGLGTSGQFRMIHGNYGAFLRNDGSNTYFLLTNSGDQYGSWNGLRPWAVNNASGYVTFGNGHGDLAENYYVTGKVLRGSIISVNNASKMNAIAADTTRGGVIGVVSTLPGAVMDTDGGFVIGPPTKTSYANEKAPVALEGSVPVLVTSQNGTISTGDPVGVSDMPGYGAKSIKTGAVVGRALEYFSPNDALCPSAASIDAISWPKDDGKNSKKPCFKLPDGTYAGKIMIALGVSWYDPDIALTSTGDLQINEADGIYRVENIKSKNIIERIGTFAQLVVAKITAGVIEAKKLVVNGLDVYKELTETKTRLKSQERRIEELEKALEQLRNK